MISEGGVCTQFLSGLWTAPEQVLNKSEIPNIKEQICSLMRGCALFTSQTGLIPKGILFRPHHLLSSTHTGFHIYWVFNVYQADWRCAGFPCLFTHFPSITILPLHASHRRGQKTERPTRFTRSLPCGAYDLAVSLTEINEHLAISLSHVLRHGKDTGYIVVEEWILFLKSRANRWAGHRDLEPKVSALPQTLNKAICKLSG